MNLMIPVQFKKDGYRFIKVRENKAPLEKRWQIDNNYAYDDPEFLQSIESDKRYGILCGVNNLLVIDFDCSYLQHKTIPKLPETFTVKSAGKGLLHKYFLVDKPESFKVLDVNNETLADVQGKGKQIIGAGTVFGDRSYEVVDDKPIATIKIKRVRELFKEYLDVETQVAKKSKTNTTEQDQICKTIKSKITIKNLLGKWGIDIKGGNTSCPFHSSAGGRCFSYNDVVWHCFHCEKKGNIFHLVMEKENVPFIQARDMLLDMIGMPELKLKKVPLVMLRVTNYVDNVKNFHNIQPFFYDRSGMFWFWNFQLHKYEIVDEIDVMNRIDKELSLSGESIAKTIKLNYIEAFKRIGRLNIPKEAPTKWIQFKDMAFSLESKKLHRITPDYFFTNPIPWKLGESDETPVMDKLFKEWVGEEFVKTLYEVIAYCCYTDYPIHTMICLVGCGRNGKSTFQQLLCNFLGNLNISSTDLDTLLNSRFETFKLYKKLACVLGETNFGTLSKTSMLKKLTGQDLIGFEAKNKNPFDALNYAKILINSNSLPASEDTSEGFYRRWLIMDFPNRFPEGKNILLAVPEQEYHNLARKVTRILPELLDAGSFTRQGSIADRKRAYIMASNPLPTFIEEVCSQDVNAFIRYSELYTKYIKYLSEKNKRIIGKPEFGKRLAAEGFEVQRTSKVDESSGLSISDNWILGLDLKWKRLNSDSTGS